MKYTVKAINEIKQYYQESKNITMEDDDNCGDVLSKEENQTSQYLEWIKMNRHNTIFGVDKIANFISFYII